MVMKRISTEYFWHFKKKNDNGDYFFITKRGPNNFSYIIYDHAGFIRTNIE